MTGVEDGGGVDSVEQAIDTIDQSLAIAFLQIGAAEPAVLEDQVAGEQDSGVARVQTEMVVLVTGSV